MTRILRPTEAAIIEGAAALRAGRLVAFPTETVYGLGGIAILDSAVAAIYAAKDRPAFNPLIVHVGNAEAIEDLAVVEALTRRAIALFWPGPLTIVLRSRPHSPIVDRARGGLDSIAVRMPADPVALALLRATGVPVAAPSANPSGRVSATTAAHVADDFGAAIEIVLDGGPARFGVESTVIDLRNPDRPALLRPGAVGAEAIREALRTSLHEPGSAAEPASPGQLPSHYAPRKPLRLDALRVGADEALLAFGPNVPAGALVTLNLSPDGDLAVAAHNFFAMLRALDRGPANSIAAMPIPSTGMGITLNDRLRRAAAPRGDDGHDRRPRDRP